MKRVLGCLTVAFVLVIGLASCKPPHYAVPPKANIYVGDKGLKLDLPFNRETNVDVSFELFNAYFNEAKISKDITKWLSISGIDADPTFTLKVKEFATTSKKKTSPSQKPNKLVATLTITSKSESGKGTISASIPVDALILNSSKKLEKDLTTQNKIEVTSNKEKEVSAAFLPNAITSSYEVGKKERLEVFLTLNNAEFKKEVLESATLQDESKWKDFLSVDVDNTKANDNKRFSDNYSISFEPGDASNRIKLVIKNKGTIAENFSITDLPINVVVFRGAFTPTSSSVPPKVEAKLLFSKNKEAEPSVNVFVNGGSSEKTITLNSEEEKTVELTYVFKNEMFLKAIGEGTTIDWITISDPGVIEQTDFKLTRYEDILDGTVLDGKTACAKVVATLKLKGQKVSVKKTVTLKSKVPTKNESFVLLPRSEGPIISEDTITVVVTPQK